MRRKPLWKTFLGALAEPLRANAAFFVSMAVLAAYCALSVVGHRKPPGTVDAALWGEMFADLYVVCALLAVLPRFLARPLRAFLYVSAYAVAAADMYCLGKFGSAITPTMLMLLGQTDGREAWEAASAFVSEGSRMGYAAGVACMASASALWAVRGVFVKMAGRNMGLVADGIGRSLSALADRLQPAVGLAAGAAFAVGAVAAWPNKEAVARLMSCGTVGEVEKELTKPSPAVLCTPAYRLAFSVYANTLAAKEIGRVMDVAATAKVDSTFAGSPNIVLIIGESYNRHHSSLYGYPLPTAPRQRARAEEGRLVPFTDVVSPWNLTSFFFKDFFSMRDIGGQGQWCDYPLFPQLFRKAGYKVAFLTNQFVPKASEAVYDFSGGFFLANPGISGTLFDIRNTRTHRYDEGLLHDYDSIAAAGAFRGGKNLVVFHLMGQHLNYRSRFPKQRGVFSPADYKSLRPELTEKKRRMVADYDNACRYNDSIVDRICARFDSTEAVIVYMPDHGEEVYERGRDIVCRVHNAEIDRGMAMHEFEIPFWISCTKAYAERHPKTTAMVAAAAGRPFMTDALPHALLFLGGIHTPLYKPGSNVLSAWYDPARPRLLKGKTDYDKIVMGNGKRR